MPENSLNRKIFTIHELNSLVRGLIHTAFPENVWVTGEIQGLRERNGIVNFDLVQKDPEKDSTVAKAGAVIFENFNVRVTKRLREIDPSLALKNDVEVKILCKVDFYPKNGQFSLRVVDIDPSFTLGVIAANRQKLINDLKKRGLLEKNKALEFPRVPLRIGLITSGDSAAYHDFLNELTLSAYGFRVMFCDSYMQGRSVRKDVVCALRYFRKISSSLDAVVITRGGGSTADLAWFDDKKIAEFIADFPIPVLAGLGHQINVTVTDLVAHTSVKTPTKAAQFLIEQVTRFLEAIDRYETGIKEWTYEYITEKKNILHHQAVQYESLVLRYFRDIQMRLTEISSGIASYTRHAFRSGLRELEQRMNLLKIASHNTFAGVRQRLKNTEEKISLLDPKAILKRGYSVTTFNGKALKDSSQVKQGDVLHTHLYRGEVKSTVTRNPVSLRNGANE
ncbi:MAG: exodeoxyribonuclease VII large subunit [Candidatus Omnitrophica bacterium]|nr:exodeoxyribonuclease VII large subunit [Candidatus Omnitrophota bacterium]